MMRLVICLVVVCLMACGVYAQNEVLEIGRRAPEIALPSPEGEVVKLSSLRGKLVLVDFWATWCAPCVEEQPELEVLYEKYNRADTTTRFEIFGVSLDRSRDQWIAGIQRLGINWTQVSDLLFWRSPVANDYGIQGLPFNVLVDEQGIIVASNLHGVELEDFISAYFDYK